MQKTDFKTLKNATLARIELIACVVIRMHALRISVFWLCRKHASVGLRVLHTTAWKSHVVSLWVGLCDSDIQLFTFLWWVSLSAVRHNIVIMSNYVMSNYVTLSRQQPVCQFGWCPQSDMSPLWPVIRLNRYIPFRPKQLWFECCRTPWLLLTDNEWRCSGCSTCQQRSTVSTTHYYCRGWNISMVWPV